MKTKTRKMLAVEESNLRFFFEFQLELNHKIFKEQRKKTRLSGKNFDLNHKAVLWLKRPKKRLTETFDWNF